MKILLISKMLEKLVVIIIYAVSSHSSQSAAENVTIEKILDLTVFGQCNIYLKRFWDSQQTLDLTEKFIHVQQENRKDYALTSIENATHVFSGVSPTVSLFEGCVLTVLVGVNPKYGEVLDILMINNNYTYSSTPFSTYILISPAYQADSDVIYPRFTMLYLPVRVFYLLLPILQNDDLNLYTRPYLLVCAHCGESSWVKLMSGSSDLAYISSLNFSSSWSRNNVQILNKFVVGYDLTGCDEGPWLIAYQSTPIVSSWRDVCFHMYSFMDVLVRSVGRNLTLSSKSERDISDKRFFGHIEKGYISDQRFSGGFPDAASVWFQQVGIGQLYFCDCNPKSQSELLKAWVTPFERSVWLGLIIIFLLLSLLIGVKLQVGKLNTKNITAKDFVAPILAIAGIFLRQEGKKIGNQRLLLLTSFCVGVILLLYENFVTSKLVVPPPKLEYNFSGLLMAAGSKVIYSGEDSPTSLELIELETEALKWNITYLKAQFQFNGELHRRKPPLENGTILSYFGFYSAVDSDDELRKLKLLNNKCHCYIVNHEFRHVNAYIRFSLFQRKRFISILKILLESGIFSFFNEKIRKHENDILLTKLSRWLENDIIHSDFFVREETRMGVIKLENLKFIFVIFGGLEFLAVNIFILKEIGLRMSYVYCKVIVLKCWRAIWSVNYARLANRLSSFNFIRKTFKVVRGSILKTFSWK
jgi:hypothetical protein